MEPEKQMYTALKVYSDDIEKHKKDLNKLETPWIKDLVKASAIVAKCFSNGIRTSTEDEE